MKKIAIVTMTGGSNYGNALQNYAVLSLIQKLGYGVDTLRVDTINGYPDSSLTRISKIKKCSISYFCRWVYAKANTSIGAKNDCDFLPQNIKALKSNREKWKEAARIKREKFSQFQHDELNYTDFAINNINYNIPEIDIYDAFVTGSDQVWNPYYRTNSSVEFLQFAPIEKRIAFAPSFGVSSIPSFRCEEYSQWIKEIPFLSVREKEGAGIIAELTNRDAVTLLDPTFGLAKEDWISFSNKPHNVDLQKNGYVFCYFLGNRTRKYTNYIEKYAKQHKCDIVDVFDAKQLEYYSSDPKEFVWLLLNAKAVFTDSFHGCSFAINLEKPFVVFERIDRGTAKQSSRITTLLNATHFENRMFGKIGVKEVDCISFEESASIIYDERKRMVEFLSQSLMTATSCLHNKPHLASKRHCTGCGVCASICPKNAIKMQEDVEGFLYPQIDEEKCVRCHICEKTCPQDKTYTVHEETEAYYAYSKDAVLCHNSSSGGLFSEISKFTIGENGVVYGAGFDKGFKVVHKKAEDLDELEELRTSKYVQSETQYIYEQVREQLEQGRKVLFSGTPCQIYSLKSYLNHEYENLLLVDIICHGVPAPMIWRKYLEQKHLSKPISNISFRDKTYGWDNFSLKIIHDDGDMYIESKKNDPFVKAFLANLSIRPSCYQCQYKSVERVSDITLGDYWGVESVHPELRGQQGVSLVILHSAKGKVAFSKIANNLVWGETDLKRANALNTALTRSIPWPQERNVFFSKQNTYEIEESVNIALKKSITEKAFQKTKRLIKMIIK